MIFIGLVINEQRLTVHRMNREENVKRAFDHDICLTVLSKTAKKYNGTSVCVNLSFFEDNSHNLMNLYELQSLVYFEIGDERDALLWHEHDGHF